ncbi:MAG: alanine--tRNA ligase-related protein [Patescibacteria group bacterium]|jgi:alanyl-tRNA synthetase
MTAQELRTKYLDFFKSNAHSVIPSASLIPENDPTVLFTTAGMHPLVPYLMGEKHPEGNRLTDVQKCIRTQDIDEVGDAVHHTFFEMMGNWSLGDYFKKEAIEMSWEFLTEVLELEKNKLAFSVFAGDDDPSDKHGASAPFDEEAYNLWKAQGVSESRIAKLGKSDNWWGPAGETGPCGPDTEMFYWTGEGEAPENFQETHDDPRWVEIWNDVFMQYNKQRKKEFEEIIFKLQCEGKSIPEKYYKYEPLKQKNVDTGMGLERTLAIINKLDDNYRTELFWPIIQKIEELSGKKYEGNERAMRIIADHIKASVFIIADGITPSNTGQGYVLRKIIRRAMYYMGTLSIKKGSLVSLVDIVIKIYGDFYDNLKKNTKQIEEEIKKEDDKTEKSIEEGRKAFRSIEKKKPKEEPITGEEAAFLHQTYSLSIDNTKGLAREYGRKLAHDFDKVAEEKMKQHQELSRTASAGMFKGGLADASDETKKLHTTAHLMLEALRRVLGEHVQQKGSNITAERLRFDFSHADKMTDEQIKQVEDIVNEQIEKNLPVTMQEMTVAEAKKLGATGVFESKYGEKVKVYSVGNFSKEICGGPHVERTGVLGKFKIKKEQSSSAGVRRIKAVLE